MGLLLQVPPTAAIPLSGEVLGRATQCNDVAQGPLLPASCSQVTEWPAATHSQRGHFLYQLKYYRKMIKRCNNLMSTPFSHIIPLETKLVIYV